MSVGKPTVTKECLEDKDEDTLTLHPLPDLTQHKKKRQQLYTSLDVFMDADKRALEAPGHLKTSIRDLVLHLIEPFQDSEILKLRVIWSWVTHNIQYDVHSYFNKVSKDFPSQDGESVLMSGKAVCAGYGNLLKAMGEVAGLHIQCVNGWSKGYSYKVGSTFKGKSTNHAWNVVFLNGSWWLLEATWASGHVGNGKKFVKEYKEHHFMPDPKLFIYDHFPQTSKDSSGVNWQLFEPHLSLEAFEEKVLLKPELFLNNIVALSHDKASIECNNGKVHVMFQVFDGTILDFASSLIDSDGNEEDETQIFMYTKGSIVHVHAVIPDIGKYKFELFARKSTDNKKELSSICSYLINNTFKMSPNMTYPKQFPLWLRGFQLHSPLEGVLNAGETYTFKISLSEDVKRIALCTNGNVVTTVGSDECSGRIWEHVVVISPDDERLAIAAMFDDDSGSFSYLLEYSVKKVRQKPKKTTPQVTSKALNHRKQHRKP